ncbi:ABC transporter ATP-binding protein [Metabacillus elymi]|uniref:ABC transporter ATP-binding protein n=1 Tax=Metabacillus elymi TaxID=2745198 RepID=A0ABX6RYH4_9BACI|nr:ABC transporter ATP-binding protein [Metabacillus sp. KUDC1714]QNF26177.1 ABC transporter ATP-binding protein [Metabacillus sp. KUDC1714]
MKQILYFTKKLHQHTGKILYLNLVGMILISLFEGIGLFLIIPLLALTGVVNLESSEGSTITFISKMFSNIPNEIGLPMILGIYVVLLTGQSYFQRKQLILNAKIQQSFLRHLREKTYISLMQSNWGFFLNKRKTDISNTMTTELARVGTTTNLFLQFIASLAFTCIQIGIAFWLSVKMTLFVLFFGLILIYLSRKFIKKASSLGGATTKLSQTYHAGIIDHFNGIKDIKSNTLEEPRIKWFRNLCMQMEENVNELVKLKTASQLRYKIASASLITVFIYASIQLFQAQPAQLLLIVLIFARLWPRFSGIQSTLETMGSMLPAFDSLLRLQEESKASKEIKENVTYNSTHKLFIKEEIECNGVFFRYSTDETSSYALEDIHVSIPAKKMTAVVGRSGAGKSTLIDLLMGLNQPERGQIIIDRTPLTDENLLPLRRSISYVSQDPFLFNTSIRENLTMVFPDASDEEIWEALEFSASAEFVRKFSKGLDTLIGDRGIRLSGGERQRLVLARAILRNPSILVLDEATSALDTENEKKIQEALEQLKGKMTIVVIAHRLSTIRNADQVIVLDQGKVVQSGGFNQLAKEKRSMFSNLLRNQLEVN